jgi:autoinducer 2-degrading protein
VDGKPGDEAAFLEASMENARQSKLEENNQRFDVLQLQSDISKYALVEIYRNEQGPTDHKGTPHYAAWRDTVADMMATPRSASQWDTVFPSSASDYAPNALILERDVPMFFDITHVFVDVKPGSEQAFIEATMENAKASLGEADARCLRFDIMQSVEDPTKFMLQEVFRSRQASASHKGEPHYEIWRSRRDVFIR